MLVDNCVELIDDSLASGAVAEARESFVYKRKDRERVIEAACQRFYEEVQEIQADAAKKGKIDSYIRRFCRGISGVDVDEVWDVAFLRGLSYIRQNGKSIRNVYAWFVKVSRFIVLDYIRREQRERLLFEKVSHDYLTSIESADPFFHSQDPPFPDRYYESVTKSLSSLNDIDREIVTLSVVQEKSYKQIQQILNNKHGASYSLAALRQRKKRALKKMKTILE